MLCFVFTIPSPFLPYLVPGGGEEGGVHFLFLLLSSAFFDGMRNPSDVFNSLNGCFFFVVVGLFGFFSFFFLPLTPSAALYWDQVGCEPYWCSTDRQ